ncbi:MAG: preprotein translocase subunit SecG [Parvularculales bacterium]
MSVLILTAHVVIAIVLVAFVLLQRSEGGALGIGDAGGGMPQGRSLGNPLTKTTTILGICFFLTSIGLSILARDKTTDSLFGGDGTGFESIPAPAPAPALPLPSGGSDSTGTGDQPVVPRSP